MKKCLHTSKKQRQNVLSAVFQFKKANKEKGPLTLNFFAKIPKY